jgi:hypothetical protein
MGAANCRTRVLEVQEVAAMSYAFREISVGFSDDRVPAGTHICYLFGDDAERQDVLARFFAAGRSARERMLLLADADVPEDIAGKLSARGVSPGDDFAAHSARDYYYDDGTFGDVRMLDLVRSFFEEAMAGGYAGARGSGDMSWVLRNIPGADKVMEYEARLTDQLAKYPATCLCQYDVRLFGGAALMDVLSVHPYTLLRGQMIKNPFFIEPAQFLERYRATRS